MRTLEIQRMEFLKLKQKSEGLNEKESERLTQLEAKAFAEEQKEAKLNGRTGQQSNAASSTRADARGVDNQGGGEVGRESESAKRTDGNKSDSPTSGPSGASNGPTGKNGNGNRSSRAKSVESDGGDGGSNRASGDTDGADDGRDGGNETNVIGGSVGDSGQKESGPQRVSNLKPRTDVKPKRKNPSKDKKKNELDSELIGVLLMSGFSLVAKATAKPHWEISEEEAESVAEPMGYLIDNMTAKQKKVIEKYANPVMLASAVAGIVVPRIMIDMAQMKTKQIRKNGGIVNVDRERTIKANIGVDTQTDIKLGRVPQNGGDTEADKNVGPINDPVITGLLK